MNRRFLATVSLLALAALIAANGAGRPAFMQAQTPITLTSVTPESAPAAGGATVTVTGTNFFGDPWIYFWKGTSATPALNVTCNRLGTVCSGTTPSMPPGPAVAYVGGGDARSNFLSFAFTDGPPIVTSISPDYGPAAGGAEVTITGTNVVPAQQFQTEFGQPFTGVQCDFTDQFQFMNSGPEATCTAQTPAVQAPDGEVLQYRIVAAGQQAPPQSNTFTAYGKPTLTSLDPPGGASEGDTIVWLYGGIFPNGTVYPGPAPDVRFGAASATGVNCTGASGTVCAVHTPPGNGTVQVTITTPGGTSGSLPYAYATPIVTAVSPSSGPSAGGTTVTITGANFSTASGATTIAFGTAAATGVTCANTTQCTAVSPPGAGTVNVRVTVNGATSADTPADDFTYTTQPLPVVTNVSPAYGAGTGGTAVTITGMNFAAGQQFQTDAGQTFTDVQCSSATTCTAKTPALSVADGGVQQFRTVAAGQTGPPQSNTFSSYGRPLLSGIDPAGGPELGGNAVTLAGSTFPDGSTLPGPVTVQFGSTTIPSVDCSAADSTCTVTAPQGTGAVQVTITTPGGTSAPVSYSYIGEPLILSITPDFGPTAGGKTVALSGGNFSAAPGATTVRFGSAAATNVSCLTTTTCTVTMPPGAAGTVQVTMTNPNGTSDPVPFTYENPIVTNISPNYGPSSGGTTVTITGSAFFFGDQQFTLADGATFTNVTCSSSTTCTAIAPSHSAEKGYTTPVQVIAVGQTAAPQASFVFYGSPDVTPPPYCDPSNDPPCIIYPHQWFQIYGGPFGDGSSQSPGWTRVKTYHTYPAPDHVQCSYEQRICHVRMPDLGITVSQCASVYGLWSVPIEVETPGGSQHVITVAYNCLLGSPAPTPTPTPSPSPSPSPSPPGGTPPSSQAMGVNGTVTQGGRPLFAGAVEALVGSSVCGAGVALNGAFTVSVVSSATIPGCGTSGATVTFRVNGVVAEGNVTFSSGGTASVALTVAGPPGPPSAPAPSPVPIPALPAWPGLPPWLPEPFRPRN